MELKTYFAQDAAGNIISSAIVNVFLQGTTTLATGLTRADGTPLENPFAADGAGRIQFRAPDGYYDVQVSAGPGIIQTLTIQCVDYADAKADADRAESAADRADVSAAQAQNALNSITGINTNFEQNSREQWRRSLAEAGLTLVSGSFEEGATVNNKTDAVWYIAGGQCYTWGSTFPRDVPAKSTPASTGGVGLGAWVGVGDASLRGELSSPGGAGLIGDIPKPITWSGFAGGADKTGATDSTAALSAVYTGANSNGMGIIIPKGLYRVGNEVRDVGSDTIWLSRDFNSGVSATDTAKKTPLLITVGNPDQPVINSEYTRVGINITAIGRGAQHIDCIRASLINYSTDGQGNTAIYASASSVPGALWSAAIHGETKHDGGTSIGMSSESASYTTGGTFYGAVLNNTTGTAAETHPTTGASVVAHPSATALYITGGNTRGEMGQWVRGIRFSALSMRPIGTLVRDESSCAQGYWSLPESSKSNADILLEGTAPQGIILQGTYSSGNAIRLKSGDAIAYEATGAVKTKYNSTLLRFGLYNGSTERVGFGTASFGMFFNGVKVVGTQQSAISDATAGTEVTTINSILSAMRNHGLISS